MSTQPVVVTSSQLAANPPPTLLDVRLAEDFHCASLPGALNNCVFEVAFADRMKTIAPNATAAICVFGAGPDSHESAMAAEKLIRLGYTNVSDFRGGLEAWQADGHRLQTTPPPPSPAPPHGTREIDLAETRIEWTGRNLLNKHQDSIAVKSGHLVFDYGQLTGGGFVFDMARLSCSDLHGDKLHDVLIAHLASDDFFDVERFPEACFAITSAAPIPHSTPGAPNLSIHGVLTIKAISHPITFLAATGLTSDGKPAAQATLSIDRTLWDVLYGSGKFFRHLGGHLVNDLIDLQLRIVTR